MKKILFLCVLSFSMSVLGQDYSAVFEKATQDYASGNYEAAIAKYEQILDGEQESVALYYNLGNAHYKLDHIAPSIFYYEKALQLSPQNQDVQNNLAFAEQMTIDAIEEASPTGIDKLKANTIGTFGSETWAKMAIAGVFIFVVFFIWYYFSIGTGLKRLLFSVSIIGMLLFIFSFSFAFIQQQDTSQERYGIIFSEEASIKAEPNPKASEAFLLHEGTKVKLLDGFNGFYKLEIGDGRQGWLKQEHVKAL
ncbi:tetratricopeptide repeat protein [Mesonia sp. MT50]|uniref:Tetratricopeptide repeat protein n=1 Tax=Mesonia profundi TaxID=3070998 RepID=A0ABU1A0A0_9FLAO|nr:tetratricopeptide repeat protein [Mesonia profundi]MDQ7917135.1 tetratricopeptide repeat protein [Mesonia profundi]